MGFDEQFTLEHLLFKKRTCRTCKESKDLIEDFYMTRKGRGVLPSSYSYECKECTKKRIIASRKVDMSKWSYPDW